MGIKTTIPGPLGFWLQYFWGIFLMLVVMGVWDLWRRRRIDPALLFGAAFLWTGEIIVTILCFSPTWRDAMVRLVNAPGLCRLNLAIAYGRLRPGVPMRGGGRTGSKLPADRRVVHVSVRVAAK